MHSSKFVMLQLGPEPQRHSPLAQLSATFATSLQFRPQRPQFFILVLKSPGAWHLKPPPSWKSQHCEPGAEPDGQILVARQQSSGFEDSMHADLVPSPPQQSL
jgi:hypothetical protein